MSTGYGWEGITQVYATLLGARHVPERLCGGSDVCLLRGAVSARPLPFTLQSSDTKCTLHRPTYERNRHRSDDHIGPQSWSSGP